MLINRQKHLLESRGFLCYRIILSLIQAFFVLVNLSAISSNEKKWNERLSFTSKEASLIHLRSQQSFCRGSDGGGQLFLLESTILLTLKDSVHHVPFLLILYNG